jgi:hypothetical protein
MSAAGKVAITKQRVYFYLTIPFPAAAMGKIHKQEKGRKKQK